MKTTCKHEHMKLCFNKDLSQYWYCPDCKEIVHGEKAQSDKNIGHLMRPGSVEERHPTHSDVMHAHAPHVMGGHHPKNRVVSRNSPTNAGRNR